MSETPSSVPAVAPVGVFGGIRNEHGDYLSIETYGPAVVIKIHQGDKIAAFPISHDNLIRSIDDINDVLKKCCDRVRSDCAVDI
jgi:hypothetical protein